jgi:predicted flap endonuclease-1-like 5' DNA nuclease/predicted  nucleic acid-binding Zn-ribbon protein
VEAQWRSRLEESENRARGLEENYRSRVVQLEGNLDEYGRKLTAADGRYAEATAKIDELGAERDEIRATIGTLTGNLESAKSLAGNLETERDELEKRVDALSRDLEQATAEAENADKSWKSRLDSTAGELAAVAATAQTAEGEVASLKKSKSELEQELATCQTRAEELSRKAEELGAKLAAQSGDLERERAQVREFSGRLSAAEALESQVKSLEVKLEAAAAAKSASDREASGLRSEFDRERASLGDRVRKEEESNRTLRDKIAELEKRLAVSQSAVARVKEAAPRQSAGGRGLYTIFRSERDGQHYFRFMTEDRKTVVRSEGYTTLSACENGVRSVRRNAVRDGGIVREVAKNGKLYFRVVASNGQDVGMSAFFDDESARQAAISLFDPSTTWRQVEDQRPQAAAKPREAQQKTRDDLKKIHGIGPKLEKVLIGLGIYRFADIARWTAADIDRISGHLDVFPGRIARDDWVGGAMREHELKYGTKI